MKLSFTNTVDELVFLTMEVYQKSSSLKRSLRLKRQLLLGSYLLVAVAIYQLTGWAIYTLVFFVIVIIFVAYLKPLHLRAVRRHFRRYHQLPENKIFLEKQTLSISSTGVAGSTSKVSSAYKWPSVLELVEYPDCYLIIVEGGCAWCIPKRIFKKGEEAEFKKAMKKVPLKKNL